MALALQTIAVVGAGMAGIACARRLSSAGLDVTVFEKSRGVGGRLATRRSDWAAYDHGAQYFTVRDPVFRRVIEGLLASGSVARWQPVMAVAQEEPWYVGVPGMSALVRSLAQGLTVKTEARVSALVAVDERWSLGFEDGAQSGLFDAVLIAVPNAQAVALVEPFQPNWAGWLRSAVMQPCWTLMISTPVLDVSIQAGSPESGPIGWFARNDSKPGRPQGQGQQDWVVQATPSWTQAHLDDDKAQVADQLTQALAAVLDLRTLPTQHLPQVHRWLYARRRPGLPPVAASLWSAATGLGVCGDGLTHSRVEQAYLSGLHLADALLGSQARVPDGPIKN